MRQRPAILATATALITITVPALPASAQTVQVTCNPAALAAAITSAPDGATITLAATCAYAPVHHPDRLGPFADGERPELRQREQRDHPARRRRPVRQRRHVHRQQRLGRRRDLLAQQRQRPLLEGPQISGATFIANSAGNGTGGAIAYDSFQAYMEITGCRFEGNTAGDGGAVWSPGLAGDIKHSVLTGNYASDDGGAVWSSADSGEGLAYDTITGNGAEVDGGGIYLDPVIQFGVPAAEAELDNSHVTGNRPDNCESAGPVAGCSG